MSQGQPLPLWEPVCSTTSDVGHHPGCVSLGRPLGLSELASSLINGNFYFIGTPISFGVQMFGEVGSFLLHPLLLGYCLVQFE